MFVGANIAISAYFTGMHRPQQSSSIAVTRALILPVGLIFLFSQWFGLMGTFYALPISEAITFMLCLFLLRRGSPATIVARSTAPVSSR